MRSVVYLLVLAVLATACWPAPEKTELSVVTDDGIELKTSLFVPKKSGVFPAVLVRTPYNRSSEEWLGNAFGRFGVAVVLQDVRGKHGSGGEFYPFRHERADGLQTLRWIRRQPWSNGKVAGWGGSYVGYTQWAISDSLDFMAPTVTGGDLYDLIYPDGLFSLQTAYHWGLTVASPTANTVTPEMLEQGYRHLPMIEADDAVLHDIPFYNDWLHHDQNDAYWQELNHRHRARGPMLSIAGWYDIFLKAQIADFEALVARGDTRSRLVIGPLVHGSRGEENEYGGERKTGRPLQIFRYVLRQLKDKPAVLKGPLKDARYNLFIMERNEYVGSEVWPPKETTMVPYYLGAAGSIGPDLPARRDSLSYTYDPNDPFPSLGGTALGEKVGPARQNPNSNRSDMLAFETPVLSGPLTLLGPISARLWLASDAPCTGFIVALHDVFPDGKIINIQEGGALVVPDSLAPAATDISVWATGYELAKGHRLRVVISSGWFPRYGRHLNTCAPLALATEAVPARQTVFFGAGTPSAILLPVYDMKPR